MKQIAEHDLTGGERRRDDVGDELRAAGREQQGFRGRLDNRARLLEDVAHLLAKRGAAGLAQAQHGRAGDT
jgi:hypothetical protein